MVGATDTIFCAAVTLDSVVVMMVCVTPTILSIPETLAFANEKIFSAGKTIFRITGKSSQALKPWSSFPTPGSPT